jgi:hypothetical protein
MGSISVKDPNSDNDFDEEILLQLYKEFNTSRIDYNTIKWRTVRFFTSLNIALLTATISILAFKNGGTGINNYPNYLLLLLPFSVIGISVLGIINLERESKLLWENEASMFKIEKYLGFHDYQIPEAKRWLKNDSCFVSQENAKFKYQSTCNSYKEWINYRWEKDNFKKIMNLAFFLEILVSGLLSIIILYYS